MSILKDVIPLALQLVPSLLFPRKEEAIKRALHAQRERLIEKRRKVDARLAELSKLTK